MFYANMRSMSRIVTSIYRYKRPPRKRKALALRAPAIVTAERGKQITATADAEVSPSAKAFFARMIRPRGQ